MPLGEAMRSVVRALKAEDPQKNIIFIAPVQVEKLPGRRASYDVHELEFDLKANKHLMGGVDIEDTPDNPDLTIDNLTLAVQRRMLPKRRACLVITKQASRNGFLFITPESETKTRRIRTSFEGDITSDSKTLSA